MPKVLVLFDNRDQRAGDLAELAAEGAKKVRFTEVDVRVVGDGAMAAVRQTRFESGDAVDQYDGVVVVGSDRESSVAIEALRTGDPRSADGEFVNRVFAAVGGGDVSQQLSALGGIVVGARAGSNDLEATARKIGERVARVAEWVRHALSHERSRG